MEKELDLTLRLGLPTPTTETQLSLSTPPTTNQGIINVDGGNGDNYDDDDQVRLRRILWGDAVINDDEGARNNVNVNIRVYNYVFQKFAGIGQTLNFSPFPMPTSPAPAPATPSVSDYVLIDVPARRAERNNSLAISNLMKANANANAKWRRGCCGGRIDERKKCTNMNCNTSNTPMWRRGPLGPKSLCNACGIKFRKEEQRRSKRALSD